MLIADPDPEAPGRIRVKLLDFGIAKVAAELNQGAAQTAADVVMGTPKYMSPEQCRGAGNVDEKADVYSLGVIMYEMLVGKPPFTGAQGEILAKQIYDEPAPIKEAAPYVPVNLAAVVHRLLIKNKAERPTMRQVAGELDGLAVAYPTTAHAVVRMPPGFSLSSANIPIPGFQPQTPVPQAASGTAVPPVAAAQSSPGEDDTPTGNRLKAAKEKAEKDSNSGLNRQSTLGGSAGQSSLSLTPAQRRRRWAVIGAASIVSMSLLAAILVRVLREEPSHPALVAPVKIERRSVLLSIESSPAGADVLMADSGHSIGLTPMKKDWPRGKDAIKLVIHLPNYKDHTVDVNPGSDVNLSVVLEPMEVPKPIAVKQTTPPSVNRAVVGATKPVQNRTVGGAKTPVAGKSPGAKGPAGISTKAPTATVAKPGGTGKSPARPTIVD